MKQHKDNGDIISGEKNLDLYKVLKNHGNIKKMTNWYMKKPALEGGKRNILSYDKREFVPFAEERDHIGRLIQHVLFFWCSHI